MWGAEIANRKETHWSRPYIPGYFSPLSAMKEERLRGEKRERVGGREK